MNAIDAIRASLNAYPEDRLDRETALALLDRLGRADARIKAVQHLIDQADEMGEWAITCTRLQWAIDGSNPPPGA